MDQRISDATNRVGRTGNVEYMLVPGLAILPPAINLLQMEMLAQALVVGLLVDRYVVLQGGSVNTRALPHATHHHLAQIQDVNSL